MTASSGRHLGRFTQTKAGIAARRKKAEVLALLQRAMLPRWLPPLGLDTRYAPRPGTSGISTARARPSPNPSRSCGELRPFIAERFPAPRRSPRPGRPEKKIKK
jgi:hypothetical protein